MCRNIKTLFNFEPPATEDEIHASSLQFVRKLSGFTKPSQANAGGVRARRDGGFASGTDAPRFAADERARARSRGGSREGESKSARAVCIGAGRSAGGRLIEAHDGGQLRR